MLSEITWDEFYLLHLFILFNINSVPIAELGLKTAVSMFLKNKIILGGDSKTVVT